MTFVANHFELPDADASLNLRKEIPPDPSTVEQPSHRSLIEKPKSRLRDRSRPLSKRRK